MLVKRKAFVACAIAITTVFILIIGFIVGNRQAYKTVETLFNKVNNQSDPEAVISNSESFYKATYPWLQTLQRTRVRNVDDRLINIGEGQYTKRVVSISFLYNKQDYKLDIPLVDNVLYIDSDFPKGKIMPAKDLPIKPDDIVSIGFISVPKGRSLAQSKEFAEICEKIDSHEMCQEYLAHSENEGAGDIGAYLDFLKDNRRRMITIEDGFLAYFIEKIEIKSQ